MRRYLLDTGSANVWVDRRGDSRDRAVLAVRDGHMVEICTSVNAELWGGVENSGSRDANIPRLQHALAQLSEWPLTTDAAVEYGRLYARPRRNGRMIGSNDLLIAAIALTLSRCILVTRDSDFDAIPSLRIENWFERQ